MCRLGCPPPKDQVFVLARVSGCVFGCAVLSVAIIWVGCVVTPKGGGGILQRAAGHSSVPGTLQQDGGCTNLLATA